MKTNDRIKGCLYGFALGSIITMVDDELTTTEFNYVFNTFKLATYAIIGNHNLAGMLQTYTSELSTYDDSTIENDLAKVISKCRGKSYRKWFSVAANPKYLHNDCLLVAIAPVLLKEKKETALYFTKISNNNKSCEKAVKSYYKTLSRLIDGRPINITYKNKENDTNITHTLLNSYYYFDQADSLVALFQTILKDGGDTRVILALAGSLYGAQLGFKALEQAILPLLSSDQISAINDIYFQIKNYRKTIVVK